MRRSAILLVVLGLALAVASTGGVFYLLQQPPSQPPSATPTPIPMVKVVVAAQDIPERTAIRNEMVAVKDWPRSLIPPGALSDPKDAIGAVTSTRIVAGEVILAPKIAGAVADVGLAPSIPPGLVAIVLSLPPQSAAGGSLKDGDAVDALVSLEYSVYDASGDESKPIYVTFYSIQDVRVLHVWSPQAVPTPATAAVASTAPGTGVPTGMIMVSLMVTPQDALLIKHAREQGTVDLVLRSPLYHDQAVTDPVYLDYIMRRFDIPQPVIVHRATTTPTGVAR